MARDDDDATELPREGERPTEDEEEQGLAAEAEPEESEEQPAEETEEAKVEEPCEGEPCGESQFVRYIRDNYGDAVADALVQKYRTDGEILRGLLNAHHLVGQRDAEATAFRKLREKLGDEEVMRILSETPGVREKMQKAVEEADDIGFDPDWYGDKIRIDPETGRFVPGPTGTKKDVANFVKFLRHRERVLNEFVRNPKKYLDDLVQSRTAQLRDEIVQELFARSQEAAEAIGKQATEYAGVQAFIAENARLLYVDGDPAKGETPLAKRMLQYSDQLAAEGMPPTRRRAELALRLAMADTQGGGARGVKPAAKRAQASTEKRLDVDDLIEKGYSLAEAFAKVNKRS